MQRRQPSTRTSGRKPTRRSGKRVVSTVSLLILFAGILAALVIIFPKEPLGRANATVGGTFYQGQNDEEIYGNLVISEIMASNQNAVPDENGEFSDYIEVWNRGDTDVNINGVGLSDREDRVRFLFPNVVLAADARVVVFASGRSQNDVTKPFHANFKVSATRETISLFSPTGLIIDQVITPMLNSNEVYHLTADGTFAVSQAYTPGYPNTEEGFASYRASYAVTDGAIIINEVMADPRTGLRDEDGELGDWVELYNTIDQPVQLSKYALSDNEANPLKWHFPEGAVIPAKGYYVVFCTGKDRRDPALEVPHTNFRISAERETLILSDTRGRMVDRLIIDNLAPDCTYGRDEYGNLTVFQIATPGMANTAANISKMELYLRDSNPTKIYFTEVMASNSSTVLYSKGPFVDWVELYNASDQVWDISGYALSDNIDRPRKWQFPQGTSMGPGEYMIVYLDGTDTVEEGRYHAGFKLTKAGGDVLTFSDPSGQVLDKMHLPAIPTDISYGRNIGLGGFFYFDPATPGYANEQGFTGFSEAPAFSLRGGEYDAPIQLSITAPQGARVYYTLDGDIPTQESTPYTGEAIALSYTTVVRAVAYQSGLRASDVITQTYLISVYHSLPIVCLTTAPDELWNEKTGMLVGGENLDKSKIQFKQVITNPDGTVSRIDPIYRTYGKELRAGYVEYYLKDGTQFVSQGIEFALQGQYSLDIPQKSFKVKAKTAQGEKYINAALFEDRPYAQYKGFSLRAGGNDGVWTRLIDGFQSRLIDRLEEHIGTTVIHQAWNPVVVYLNGVYWGHYNMRERVDRYFVAQHEGIPLEEADNMDILEASGGNVNYGTNAEYKELIATAKTLKPGQNPEDLQYILDRIDVDNYFDYMAISMFFGNSDPGNIRFYKLHGEGQKWKWIIYDMDYGMFNSGYDSPKSYLKEGGAGDQHIDNTLIRKLLENDEMKNKFLTRLGEIYQILTTGFMLEELEKMVVLIEPEMPLHFARWAELNEKGVNVESPLTADGALRYWNQRVDRLRNTAKKRPNLFYAMVQEQFNLSNAQMVGYFGERPEMPADAK